MKLIRKITIQEHRCESCDGYGMLAQGITLIGEVWATTICTVCGGSGQRKMNVTPIISMTDIRDKDGEIQRWKFEYYDDAPHDSGMERDDEGDYVEYDNHLKLLADERRKGEERVREAFEAGAIHKERAMLCKPPDCTMSVEEGFTAFLTSQEGK